VLATFTDHCDSTAVLGRTSLKSVYGEAQVPVAVVFIVTSLMNRIWDRPIPASLAATYE
jgi:hypothetical protein